MSKDAKKEDFLKSFENNKYRSNNPKVQELLLKSEKSLNDLSFPTSRSENWKYTRVGKLINSNFNTKIKEVDIDSSSYEIESLEGITLVFDNGTFNEALSDSISLPGLKIQRLKDRLDEDDSVFGTIAKSDDEIFTALNTIYLSEGVSIETEANFQTDQTIHLVFVNHGEDAVQQPRNLIQLAKGSKLDIVISFLSTDENKHFTNHVLEFLVHENAQLTTTVIESINSESFLINEMNGVQKSDSTVTINTCTAKGNWIRNNIRIDVDGTNCMSNLYGVYQPEGKEHIDNHTVIDHLKAHCESNELYKGIIRDNATAVFNGKVFVRKDAQKTNAYQQNANIVMSDNATINSKPELEIYADDVKCSHGSTIGQFDQSAIFYLQARGISIEKAKNMLVSAFISDVIDHIEKEEIRNHISKIMGL